MQTRVPSRHSDNRQTHIRKNRINLIINNFQNNGEIIHQPEKKEYTPLSASLPVWGVLFRLTTARQLRGDFFYIEIEKPVQKRQYNGKKAKELKAT